MSILQNPLAAERILSLAFNSLLIFLLTWILTRLFRQKAAPIRSAIILVAIVILLILPLLQSSSLMLGIPSITTVIPVAFETSHQSEESMNKSSSQTHNAQLAPQASLSTSQNPVQKVWLLFTSYQSGPAIIQIINSLGMIWILGSLILLMKLIHGILSLRKIKNDLKEIHDNKILKILETAERTFTNHPRTTVFTSRKIFGPLAIGIFKPLIILPHDLYKKLKDNEIRGILLHELSHVYHKDQISGILQRLAAALHWWNPIVYTLSADLSRAREEISDSHVLLENDKKEYAECLINLAERTSLLSRLPVVTGMASPHFPLKDRVTNILSKERIMETTLKKSTIWMIVLASLFILGIISGHRLTFASAEKTIKEGIKIKDAAEVKPKTEPSPTAKAKPLGVEKPMPAPQEKSEKVDKLKLGKTIFAKPKLVKKVEPVYPDEAKEAGLEGAVVVEGLADEKGKVVKVKIIKGEHELLNNSAIAAVKQWEYEPFIINGKPKRFEFTVTMRFKLNEKDEVTTKEEDVDTGIDVDVGIDVDEFIDLPDDVELKLIKRVDPKYPREALKKLIGGKVVLEALIDNKGNVVDAKVIESEHETLNDAAIAAVKQWKYEPYKKEGKAQKVRYKIELKFHVK